MAVMFKVILSERIHLWKYEDRLKDFLEESEMMAPRKDGKQIALDCPRLKCTVEEFITGQTSTRDFTKADLEEKNYLFLIENETSEEKIIKRLSQVKVVIAI